MNHALFGAFAVTVGQALTASLNEQVIIVNRLGAGGQLDVIGIHKDRWKKHLMIAKAEN